MKKIHKTLNTLQTLQKDILGLLYDIKELSTTYQGNLIALGVAIAVAVFNYNRPNAGMLYSIFFLKKRVTVKNHFDTKNNQEETTLESTTVTVSPTNSITKGNLSYFPDAIRYLRDRLFH